MSVDTFDAIRAARSSASLAHRDSPSRVMLRRLLMENDLAAADALLLVQRVGSRPYGAPTTWHEADALDARAIVHIVEASGS